METQQVSDHDREEARRALLAARREERKTSSGHIPKWLLVYGATLSFGFAWTNLAPPPDSAITVGAVIALTTAMIIQIVLLVRYVWHPKGYRFVRIRWKVLLTIACIAMLLVGGTSVVAALLGNDRNTVSGVWSIIAGVLCLLPVLLDAAEKRWPKRKGHRSA
ncbi:MULTISPECIES: hypothetical protein [unclassified Brevibacterium]|uniref:hypothetical protein n=1 Tax=unclassified Brevibacterium TaxID=2614124 RepID=UPI0020181961|nr:MULTISPECIES: hypothetical protein [unclassified Brevibacterium]MCM1011439.1 hypothetical protein [Brevibacterium sp. XM4083]